MCAFVLLYPINIGGFLYKTSHEDLEKRQMKQKFGSLYNEYKTGKTSL